MERFEELKKEIIERAEKADACKCEKKRLTDSKDTSELMQVIKDNFSWASRNGLDSDLIEKYRADFNSADIYCNESTNNGYLICNSLVEEVGGNAIACVRGNATIQNVRGNATIQNVWESATIQNVWENAYISTYSLIECKLSDNAIYRIRESNTILYASDEIKFKKV